MCAVILIFAFSMSLVINIIERTIAHQNDQASAGKEAEEAYATKKSE